MNTNDFNAIIREQIDRCENTLCKKAEEYYAAIFDENIKAHGIDLETGIAMEECAELIQAVSKVRRYGFVGKFKDNLLEEIADVDIVLTELTMMFDIDSDEFFKIRDRKVQRIKERLKQSSTRINTHEH